MDQPCHTASPQLPSPRRAPWRSALGVLAIVGTGVAAAVCLAQALLPLEASWVFPVPQLVAFGPWFGLLALACGILALVARRRLVAVVALACVLYQALACAGYWIPAADPRSPSASVTAPLQVMTLNCYFGQADAQGIVDAVRDQDVQVLCLQETTQRLTEALYACGLDDLLPYTAGPVTGDQIWSALPLEDEVDDAVGYSGCLMPAATVEVGDLRLRFVSIHTCAPMPGLEGYWFESLSRIAALRGYDAGLQSQDRYVLMGDFNAMLGHRVFQVILDQGFTDGVEAAGEGLVFTWPIDRGPGPLVTLDHILLDEGLGLGGITYLDVPGTDHRGILAQLAWSNP